MALNNAQKSLLKQAHRQARLADDDYRDILQSVSGHRSSTEPGFDNRDMDKALAFIEAEFWLKVDRGQIQPDGKPPFSRRRFWANRNNLQETSRDRFKQTECNAAVARLESELAELGYGPQYVGAIRNTATKGETSARALFLYKTALERTLRSKQRHAEANPF